MDKNLKQLFEEYITECRVARGLRPQTITGYDAVFSHFSAMMPEVIFVGSLTREAMIKFFERIKDRKRMVGKDTIPTVGLKDSTIKTYGNKLNAFFVWLIQKDIMVKNPLDNIKLKFPQYNDPRALKEEDVDKIISAVSSHSTDPFMLKRDMMMLYVLLFCGLRAGEFIALRMEDIDMNRKVLTVRAETSKSKRSRTMPIHPTLLIYLQEYIEERNKFDYKTEYLIVSSTQDKGLTCHGLKHWVKRLIELSGVRLHLHRFRHTYACNLHKKVVPIVAIRDLMGHRSAKMTEVYLRSMQCEDFRKYVNML